MPGAGAGRVGVNDVPRNVVEIKDVSKTFPRGNTVALQGIDLDIAAGEFISLIGPSGCGKSTLLRIIGDLIDPSTGAVTVNGKRSHQARLDRDYGIVFQHAVLYDWRTVQKNIALPLEMLGWSRQRRAERIREMLELVELTGFENHGGRTALGADALPLAQVRVGVGNGGGDGTEGALAGRIVGTYLHGPVLARNPALADLLLGWALGVAEFRPLDDAAAESLRAERIGANGRWRFRRRIRRRR